MTSKHNSLLRKAMENNRKLNERKMSEDKYQKFVFDSLSAAILLAPHETLLSALNRLQPDHKLSIIISLAQSLRCEEIAAEMRDDVTTPPRDGT